MSVIPKFPLAVIAAGAFLLAASGLQAMDITTPEQSGVTFDINGFVTVAPGVVIIDAADSNPSGDPDPQFPEMSLEARIHFTFGTEDFKITGSQWTRDDAVICRNLGNDAGGDGKSDCSLQMVYLDWDITDDVRLHMGRSGNVAHTWNQRTCIWETYMGWTPVLPAGCYLMHLEGNDTIDLTWRLGSLVLGINAREEPGISSRGATVGADPIATGGNLSNDCSAGGTCGQSIMAGPTWLYDVGPGTWFSGTFQFENQSVGPTHDDSEDLSHTGLLLVWHHQVDDRGSMYGVQYTRLDIETGGGGDDITVDDVAAQVMIAVGDGPKLTANFNQRVDDDGTAEDTATYWDLGFQHDAYGPGQRVGVAVRQLINQTDASEDENSAMVVEASFWQGF